MANKMITGKIIQYLVICLMMTALVLLTLHLLRLQQPTWRVMIAIDGGGDISEDWNWFWGDLKTACEDDGILMVYAQPDDLINPAFAVVQDGISLTTVDLSAYRTMRGYLLIKERHAPYFLVYDQPDVILAQASAYYGLKLGE